MPAPETATSPPDIDTFIESLWTERLPEAIENAATVDDVLALAATDASGARKEFGREVGLGGPTFFFLRGRGQIESVNEDECRLIIDGPSATGCARNRHSREQCGSRCDWLGQRG